MQFGDWYMEMCGHIIHEYGEVLTCVAELSDPAGSAIAGAARRVARPTVAAPTHLSAATPPAPDRTHCVGCGKL